jgi:hypothetical protein
MGYGRNALWIVVGRCLWLPIGIGRWWRGSPPSGRSARRTSWRGSARQDCGYRGVRRSSTTACSDGLLGAHGPRFRPIGARGRVALGGEHHRVRAFAVRPWARRASTLRTVWARSTGSLYSDHAGFLGAVVSDHPVACREREGRLLARHPASRHGKPAGLVGAGAWPLRLGPRDSSGTCSRRTWPRRR